MVSSQIRQEARVSLTGKWGKAALLTLCYTLVTFAISWILGLIPYIGSIAYAVISVPISYGILVTFVKLKRGEEVSYIEFLTVGFSVFGKLWGIVGHTLLKLLIPIIVLVVSIVLLAFGTTGGIMGALYSSSSATTAFSAIGIIGLIAYIVSLVWIIVKSFYYVLTSYILFDNPDLSSKEIVEKSESIMNGKRGSYFCLYLSFIGWAFLACFTLGIGMLWLAPYIMVSTTIFYEDKAGILNAEATKTSEAEVIE